MPKLGMEPIRRAALVSAAIHEIGSAGSSRVTVSQIARRAGVSSALAHHYFGSKDRIFLAAMQQILVHFGASVRRRLRGLTNPIARLDAVIEACFGDDQFEPEVVAAWLVFYVEAQTSPDTARLLRIYRRRLHTNLVHELAQLVTRAHAERTALQLGALIDGHYIRQALPGAGSGQAEIIAMIKACRDQALVQARQ